MTIADDENSFMVMLSHYNIIRGNDVKINLMMTLGTIMSSSYTRKDLSKHNGVGRSWCNEQCLNYVIKISHSILNVNDLNEQTKYLNIYAKHTNRNFLFRNHKIIRSKINMSN